MRKAAARAILLALGLSSVALPLAAEAHPSQTVVQATFEDIGCPNEERVRDDTPDGKLSYNLMAAEAVHRYSKGRDIRIGILDSGVNPAHSTLAEASLEDGVDLADSGGAKTDAYGSGTAFASMLVGRSDGKFPVRGVAPDATIVPIKILDDVPNPITDEYLALLTLRLASGIDWAVDNDLDVVVTSVDLPAGTDALAAAVERAQQAGVLIVAPVGEIRGDEDAPASDEEAYRFPAAYDSVLAVTAVTGVGGASSSALYSDAVDLAGPGENIPAANNVGADATCLLGRRTPATSFAAVNVAGVAALLMSARPEESIATIVYRMEATAIRPESDRPTITGWGIVDAAGAMHFIDDGTAHGPDSPDHERPTTEEMTGREPIVAEPDPQRATKPIAYVGMAVGVALTLVILLGAAGLSVRSKR